MIEYNIGYSAFRDLVFEHYGNNVIEDDEIIGYKIYIVFYKSLPNPFSCDIDSIKSAYNRNRDIAVYCITDQKGWFIYE